MNDKIIMSDERLERLHSHLIDILNYIDKICRENDLKYYLTGGTALGAVRHKGFIPWDDDMDIAMLREDYERFIQIVRNADNSKFYIQDEEDEPRYFLPFIKVRKRGTVFREAIAPDVYQNNGIFVDVFPLDYTNNIDSISFRVNYYLVDLYKRVLRYRTCKAFYNNDKMSSRMTRMLLCAPFCLTSNKSIIRRIKKRMIKFNTNNRTYCVSYGGTYSFEKETFPYEMIDPPSEIFFHAKEYMTYSKVKDYLKKNYGDYMRLPPVENRHTHEPVELIM